VTKEPSFVNARINYVEILQSAGRSADAVTQLETAQRLAAGTELEQVARRSLEEVRANAAVAASPAREPPANVLGKEGEVAPGDQQ